MKKYKVIIPMLMVFVLLAFGFSCDVYAANSYVDTSATSNKYTATGAGTDTDHSKNTYWLDGTQAYCIQAGVPIHNNMDYEISYYIYDGRLSWIAYNVSDTEERQAAIWQLSGNGTDEVSGLGYGSYVINLDSTIKDILKNATNAYNNRVTATNSSITVSSYDFTYDKTNKQYVSSEITVSGTGGASVHLTSAPSGAYVYRKDGGECSGDGVYIIVVPASAVTDTTDEYVYVELTAENSSSVTDDFGAAAVWQVTQASVNAYNAAHGTSYTRDEFQLLITPSKDTTTGAATSATFKLECVGDLLIKKTDEWNKPISGCTFYIKGSGFEGTVQTDENGEYLLEGVKIGTYTIQELSVTGNLVLDTKSVDVTVQTTRTATYTMTNEYKRGSARIQKVDYDYGTEPTGDCKLYGAVYGLYADEDIYEGETLVFSAVAYDDATKDNAIITVTTGEDGWTEVAKEIYSTILGTTLDGIPIGNYYWKELEAPEGYLRADEDDIDDNDKIKFEVKDSISATEHDEPVVNKETENQSIRGRVDVLKYENEDGSEETPEPGVTLRLVLISDSSQYYDIVTDENGYGEFVDYDYLKIHYGTTTFNKECTIPYGKYRLYEVDASEDGSENLYYIQDVEISVENDQEKVNLTIVSDEKIPFKFQIVKGDKDTLKVVSLAGTKFKIWNCETGEFVSQKVYPTENYYDEFTTNEEGYFILPDEVYTGKYIIYETQAPEGYYLDDEYRLPDDESDYGDASKGGLAVYVTKTSLGLSIDAVYDKDDELIAEVEVDNTPQKATITVYKEGEVLVGTTETNVATSDSGYTDEGGEAITADVGDTLYTFNYEYQGLEGVTYEIKAVEDIVSSDGNYVYHEKGWTTTMTTGSDGYATSDKLYLGEYVVREIEVPDGYTLSNKEYEVTLEYEGQYVEVYDVELEAQDERQKLELTFKKVFEDPTYTTRNYEEAVALFGVYTSTDIKINNVYVSKDSLVDLIWTDEESQVTSNVDLPAGTYYVKELYVTYPYAISGEVVTYNLAYTSDSTQEFVVYEGEDWVNTVPTAPLMILKLSTSSTDQDSILSLSGSELTEEAYENLANLSQDIYDQVKNLSIDETKEYLDELMITLNTDDQKKLILVKGVTYQVFMDEDCTIPLYKKNEETGEYTELVTVTTDVDGAAIIEDIPYGVYYVQEVSAPKGYQIVEDAVEIYVNESTSIPKVFQITTDPPDGKYIYKTDIFTGDVVPDCTFEITDEEGNILVHSITDSEGYAKIPVDIFEDGKTYYYTEIDAPEEYNIDTTPHAFVASIDDTDWVAELIPVTNTRKTGTVQIIKSDADTGERLEGCVFTIVLLDDDGNEYVNAAGETIYLVQDAVTDENGEYLIEDVPYGTYKFVEMVAPEGYELDEDMTGLTFTVSDDSNYIVFEVTNTGDIAVIALVCVALVSGIGIVYVISKRKSVKNSI